MARLRPYPFGLLVARMLRELESEGPIFDLPRDAWCTGSATKDTGVSFLGRAAASPLGPAAGPHTQMAQNILLAWLAGGRILELKTVQVEEEPSIPRPCIDMRTVGFNAEWSQELTLEESLEEYVKGAMLVEILRAGGRPGLQPGFGRTIFDISLGYDLESLKSRGVRRFLQGMLDAGPLVDRLRRSIPAEWRAWRDHPFPTRIAATATLSTFHGCPPEEIRDMVSFLMQEFGLACVIKFNPMLLGREETRHLLHDVLGYTFLSVPDQAFAGDTTWDEAVAIVASLEATARRLGVGLGVKLANTLIVENRSSLIPRSQRFVYLSGRPLHILAMTLVGRFRERFGDRLPLSFSGGIDRHNVADAVALGLVPVTACSDLLRPGGYGRLNGYYRELERRMELVGATTIADYIVRACHQAEAALELAAADAQAPSSRVAACRAALAQPGPLREAAGEELFERWVARAALLNTRHYLRTLAQNPRYGARRNLRRPRKLGRRLRFFDCIACDLCISVCPNGANFAFEPAQPSIPRARLVRGDPAWSWEETGRMALEARRQYATFADFCNDCGNCDVFCPEDGGPYLTKPQFFGSRHAWERARGRDGFFMWRRADREVVLGRLEGREYRLDARGDLRIFSGSGFRVAFRTPDPAGTLDVRGPQEIDLVPCFVMDLLRRSILDARRLSHVNAPWEIRGR